MKKLYICVAAIAASFAQVSFAGTISSAKPAVCANSADCSINGVALSGSVTAKVEDRVSQLKLVGAGLRKKTIVVVPINVYVVQFYAIDPSKISRTSDGILASVDTQQTVAMTLTFRRDVTASQIQDAFKEGFEANGVDTASNQIATLLDYALKSGVAKTGQVMTFVGEYFTDGSTAVTFESTQGNAMTIKGDKNFVHQVMSLWLGVTADSGLESAKNDILRDRKTK